MGMREQKKRATAARIRSVAGELFLESGFEATSIEAIAEAAGVSRASLFNYYRGKPAILEAMAAELEPRLLQLLDHYLAKPLSSAQRIAQLFGYAGRVLSQTAPLTRLMFVHAQQGADFVSLQGEFTRLMIIGQRQGDVRQDLPAAELGNVVYLSFVAALLGWSVGDIDLEQQLEHRAQCLVQLIAGANP